MSEPPSMTWQQPPTNESWIKRHKELGVVIAAILLSILVSVVGAILGDYGDTATTAEPTPTTTCDLGGCEETLGPTALPADETTEPAATSDLSGNIDKSDIELRIKTLRKKCSGSGCDVTYRVVVDRAYMDDWPKTGDVYVSYTVTGPEDGPEYGNVWIWLEDESYEEPWEQVISTRSRSVELTVKVTDVEYSA
ncbi:MAG TPA: hypothetical protein VFP81_00720 [Propionibacteriaceae bacterium]|nr:hypothetical protein [Propionibacteriaceae bacterium]